MNREEMLEKLICVVKSFFNDSSLNIMETSGCDTIEEWDSLAQIQLALEIENEFDMQFDASEIAKLITVKDILEIMQKHMK